MKCLFGHRWYVNSREDCSSIHASGQLICTIAFIIDILGGIINMSSTINLFRPEKMIKRMILTFLGILLVIGVLAGIKSLQIGKMVAASNQFAPPPTPVTATEALKQTWESRLTSVGTLEAVQGVMVTAELPGKVVRIVFDPGSMVTAGDILVYQDTTSETAQLQVGRSISNACKDRPRPQEQSSI